jgi:hypothetical protein
MRSACVLLPETKPESSSTLSHARSVERSNPPSSSIFFHSHATFLAVVTDHVPNEALEVGGFGDIHRRAGGRVRLGSLPRPITAGAKELIEHVVLVRCEHEAVDRQAQPLRH